MFIEQYLFFCVKIVCQISKWFFFSFDFLINTWNFLSVEFTVITIHAGACLFVFCFVCFGILKKQGRKLYLYKKS